jgi:hypothetical protein
LWRRRTRSAASICLSNCWRHHKNGLLQPLYTQGNLHLPLRFASSLLESA